MTFRDVVAELVTEAADNVMRSLDYLQADDLAEAAAILHEARELLVEAQRRRALVLV